MAAMPLLRRPGARRAPALVLAALAAGLCWASPASAQTPAFPFGSHRQPYASGSMRPSTALATLTAQTAAFYDQWKARYLKPGCKAGHYRVKADTDFGATVVSEGQGYGMLIVALMAGHDPNAKTLFDGLHHYNRAHPSGIDPDLTEWSQKADCTTFDSSDNATDGDLDIAYALLLAFRQWGPPKAAGDVDYKAAARRVVIALKRSNIDAATNLTNLGDWVPTAGDAKFRSASRSSDWMPDHFRAFARRVGPGTWTPILDAHLAAIKQMQDAYAPATGLLPDFVSNTRTTPRPAPANFLEGPNDGRYNYNACRDPWRIGLDAALSGDSRSKAAARRISQWIRAKTAGKPAAIRDGYTLTGNALQNEYNTMAFVAPFAVAAISDPGAQDWINALWREIVRTPPQGYYPDSIKLLSMIAVSRNWVAP
jgi:endoglucanase